MSDIYLAFTDKNLHMLSLELFYLPNNSIYP
jgi:hypothetical protein